jgi:hypothetical protein
VPDRPESRGFFEHAAAAGLAWRFLRRCAARADLPTPVSVWQLARWAGSDTGGRGAAARNAPGPVRARARAVGRAGWERARVAPARRVPARRAEAPSPAW